MHEKGIIAHVNLKTSEAERQRRSMLIFGTTNMGDKQREHDTKVKGKKERIKLEIQNRTCTGKLFLHPEEQFLSIWDVAMLFVIGYSCFTSAYYLAFKMTS